MSGKGEREREVVCQGRQREGGIRGGRCGREGREGEGSGVSGKAERGRNRKREVWQGREGDGENTVPIMLSVNC